MDHVPDHELIVQLQQGEIAAFNRIYEKYHQALYRNIVKVTKSSEAAADLLQDVFVTLWERRADLVQDKSLGGWLFVISFHKAVNYVKKELTDQKTRSRVLRLSEKSEEEQGPDSYEVQYGLLQRAISELSPQKQKIFILCKLEGKSYEEAARSLNISRYTVKEYLSSAMLNVRDYVKNHPQYMNTLGAGMLILMDIWLR